MKKNEEMLQKGSFPELAVHLCIPAIVIMLIMVIYDMADVYFIGKTADPVKVAAVSLCAPVFSMLSGLGTLPGSGGCIVLSLAMGRRRRSDPAPACASMALWRLECSFRQCCWRRRSRSAAVSAQQRICRRIPAIICGFWRWRALCFFL